MQLCKVEGPGGEVELGVVEQGRARLLHLGSMPGLRTLSDVLHADDPAALVQSKVDTSSPGIPLEDLKLLPPLDAQEVWAAGVTYTRSREARERESAGAARFYDLVYKADRPELFFKATPRRVVGPGGFVQIRQDARWSVPEPEVALVISPSLKVVGYTIGNDMSSRDIEGENPLYLPQAKVYNGSCALGPVITLAKFFPPLQQAMIQMTIVRGGNTVFDGSTSLAAMARSFADLVGWLGRDNSFPDGVILLTGTGIVPPDHFTLAGGDVIHIDVMGVGRLTNSVK
jgi:2-dehydro-3-deoxy-D-arabinonate dehydratase